MPYESLAQERWAHTKEGQRALGGTDNVAEWDKATKGKTLPERVGSHAGGGNVKSYEAQHDVAFASGGPVLGRTANFLKQPDRFSKGMASNSNAPLPDNKTDDDWGKGSSKSNPKGADKSEKPVLPSK